MIKYLTKSIHPKICKNCPFNSQLCRRTVFCKFWIERILLSRFLKKRLYVICNYILKSELDWNTFWSICLYIPWCKELENFLQSSFSYIRPIRLIKDGLYILLYKCQFLQKPYSEIFVAWQDFPIWCCICISDDVN